MKKVILVILLFNLALVVKAQDEEEEEASRGFKKEKLFTGGNLIISFYTGGMVLGVSPHFGYSITNWLDAAASLNFTYSGETDPYNNKLRQTNIGPGAFIRIFPFNFFFAQVQYEHNFLNLKAIPSNSPTFYIREDVNSLLLGGGIASGRSKGNNTYYFFSIMVDALKLKNSPYVDSYGRLIPVIRAGFNIALFQGNRQGE